MKQKLNKVGHFCFLSASFDDPFYLAVNKTQGQWRTLASFSIVFEVYGLKGVKRTWGLPAAWAGISLLQPENGCRRKG